jgi:hypothetical protein
MMVTDAPMRQKGDVSGAFLFSFEIIKKKAEYRRVTRPCSSEAETCT